jgi:hypothetical protein
VPTFLSVFEYGIKRLKRYNFLMSAGVPNNSAPEPEANNVGVGVPISGLCNIPNTTAVGAVGVGVEC